MADRRCGLGHRYPRGGTGQDLRPVLRRHQNAHIEAVPGTGLGPPVVQAIVELHGGRLKVEPYQVRAGPSAGISKRSDEDLKILLIEDNPNIALAVRTVLGGAGFIVDAANYGCADLRLPRPPPVSYCSLEPRPRANRGCPFQKGIPPIGGQQRPLRHARRTGARPATSELGTRCTQPCASRTARSAIPAGCCARTAAMSSTACW